jgi:uncharacterized protein (DUF983 family)
MSEPRSGTASAIRAGLRGRCPRCGAGALFAGFVTVAPSCDRCGLDFGFADSGDGPAVFIMLIAGFALVGAALFVELRYEPVWWVHALIWPPLVAAVCLGLMRPLKGIMIALQFTNQAGQGRLEG